MSSKKKKHSTLKNGNKDIASPWVNLHSVFSLFIGATLATAIVFVAVARINLSDLPMERDTGEYVYFGKMILDGKIPYVDFYDDKPPGNYYLYATLVFLSGYSIERLRIAFLVINIISLMLIFFIAKRLISQLTGLVAAVAFAIMSLAYQVSGFTMQSEHLVVVMVLAGILAFIQAENKGPVALFFLSGCLVGYSVWIKQSGIFFFIAFILYFALSPWKRPWRKKITIALSFIGGATAVSIGFFAIIAAQGAFPDFWYSVYFLPKIFAADGIPLSRALDNFHAIAMPLVNGFTWFWFFGITGLLAIPVLPIDIKFKILLSLLAIFSFMTPVPGFTFYSHYWLQVLPVLCIGIGIAVFAAGSSRLSRLLHTSPAILRPGAAALFFIIVFAKIISDRHYYFEHIPTHVIATTYGDNLFTECKKIGLFLRTRITENEPIAVLGSEPQIFVYSKASGISRHVFKSHLVNSVNPLHGRWQKEYIKDFENSKPRFCVFIKHPCSWMASDKAETTLIDWVGSYLNTYYEIVVFVDLVGPVNAHYVWNDQIKTYTPVGKSAIYVLQRRPDV